MPEFLSAKTAAQLDDLAHRGWPALETHTVGEWIVRWAGGVTRRANSVLPRGDVDDLDAAIDTVESAYRDRGLPSTFQLSPASRPPTLASRLESRGYVEDAHTLILVADAARVAAAAAPAAPASDRRGATTAATGTAIGPVSVGGAPSDEWMELWWSVDGRGGDVEREIARRILTGTPALYASLRDDAGIAAAARLVIVDDWAGLYAVATRPDARRRGLARRLVGALAAESAGRGVSRMWLQVLADNDAAIALYRSLGFETVSGYSYWTAPEQSA
jgi:ribosomal protein S18 acetylase RimI-like enzyme